MRHKYPSFAAASGQSLRSSPRGAMPCRRPATGYARDEQEYFRGIAKAVVPRRQPTSDVVGNMVKKDPPDGQPQVVYLEKALNDQFGPGSVRVICPITDPFVKHHGPLGSFVRVYATGSVPAQTLMDAAARIPGVALILDGESAAARYEMPPEREG